MFKLEGHEGTVRALTLHEEDELLYRCVLFVCSGGNFAVNFASFSTTRMHSTADDRTIRVWNCTTGQPITIITGHGKIMLENDDARC